MAVTNGEVISKHEGLALLRQGRAAEAPPTGDKAPATGEAAPNPVSEAARTLALSRNAKNQAPAADKPAKVPAPAADKPEDAQAADNAEEAPEGQDGEAEQPEEANDEDGADAITLDEGKSIILDGEKLTAQEIRDSYLRRDDYTRKTQEVAERTRALDGALGAVTQSSQRLDQLVAVLEQAIGQEPDWVTLAGQLNPQQFLAQKEQWAQQKQALSNVQAEKQRSAAQAIQTAKAQMFQEAARTFRPDWQDRAKMNEGVKALADYAVSEGIAPEELQMLYRTPMLKLLDKAYRFDELMSKQRVTDKKVVNKPKPLKPGTQVSRPSAAETQFQAEKTHWESIKRPTIKDSQRWIQAKRSYESSTGRRAG